VFSFFFLFFFSGKIHGTIGDFPCRWRYDFCAWSLAYHGDVSPSSHRLLAFLLTVNLFSHGTVQFHGLIFLTLVQYNSSLSLPCISFARDMFNSLSSRHSPAIISTTFGFTIPEREPYVSLRIFGVYSSDDYTGPSTESHPDELICDPLDISLLTSGGWLCQRPVTCGPCATANFQR